MDYNRLNLENATFKKTISNFYLRCSSRIKEKKGNKTLEEIYPDDIYLLSNVINCNCGKNNPYLISKVLIDGIGNSKEKKKLYKTNEAEPYGLIPKLGFSEFEIFWGNEREFEENLLSIFFDIINDLLCCNLKYGIDIDYILCDYAKYAKCSRYKLLSYYSSDFLLKYYGVVQQKNDLEYNISIAKAISLLYNKPNLKENFRTTFYDFAKNHCKFQKIDSVFENEYIKQKFIPLLKEYVPDSTSLGIRVKELIEADLFQSKNLIRAYENRIEIPFSETTKKLINASSSYIVKLEKLQEEILAKTTPQLF